MKITDIVVSEIEVPLKTPFKTALRTVYEIKNLLISIHTDTGEIGLGEAPPTAVITGETLGSIKCAINSFIKPAIIGMDIESFEEIMQAMHHAIYQNTSAKAAVDMALYDLYGKKYKAPVYKLLGGYRKELVTDITISVNEIDEMVHDSVKAVENGFSILKIKVGNDAEKDVKRIVEIRNAVGKNVVLRVDANQGWKPKEAIRIIRRLEEAHAAIELVEQPVKYDDIDGMEYVTKQTSTKILADESVFSPKDAIKIIQRGAADLINIKLMKTGGIYEAKKIVDIAEMHGVECMIGCMLETKISVSAAAHFAAANKNITYVDLDGPSLCKQDPIEGGPIFHNQLITMTNEHGLGFK